CGVGSFHGVIRWPAAWSLHALQLVGAIAGGALLLLDPSLRRRVGAEVMGWTVALLVLVAIAPLHADHPRFARPALLAVPGAVGWALCAMSLLRGSPVRRRWAARYLAAAGLGLSIWAYLQFRAGVTVRPSLPLGHHNFLAGTLLLLLGPTLATLFTARRAISRLALGAAALGMISTLAGTSSLGAALGLVGGATVAIHVIGPRRVVSRMRRSGGDPLVVAVLSVFVVVGVTILVPGGPRIASRVATIVSGGADTSLRNRADYANGALRGLVTEQPVLGFGIGATPLRFPLHRIQRRETEEVGKIVTQLHSTPVHLAYETGVAGLVIAVGLVLALARRSAAVRSPEAVGALAALGAYAVSSLGDFQLHVASIPATIALVLGLALGDVAAAPHRDPRGLGRALGIALPLLGLLGAALLVPVDRAHRLWDRSLDLEDVSAAAQACEEAVALDPAFGFYQQQLALLLRERGGEGQRTVELFRDAARRLPTSPLSASLAGEALLADGRAEESLPHLRLAASLDLGSPLPWFFLGEALKATGDAGAALEIHERAIRTDPRLCGALAYRTADFDEARLDLARRFGLPPELAQRAGDPPASTRALPANAWLRTLIDEDPWRSRSAFVFRRRGKEATTLAVPVTAGVPFDGLAGYLRETELRFPGVLGPAPGPELPARAADLLREPEWAPARELVEAR
ncbi:MAG: tetratricopeptide repeat protein, partial [Planctomycetota bacterium]|nr:tetratricopeptide repeat protein [Planctomycetota bacterium]